MPREWVRRLGEFRLENIAIFVEEAIKTYPEVLKHLAKRPELLKILSRSPELLREILSRVSDEELCRILRELPRERLERILRRIVGGDKGGRVSCDVLGSESQTVETAGNRHS